MVLFCVAGESFNSTQLNFLETSAEANVSERRWRSESSWLNAGIGGVLVHFGLTRVICSEAAAEHARSSRKWNMIRCDGYENSLRAAGG